MTGVGTGVWSIAAMYAVGGPSVSMGNPASRRGESVGRLPASQEPLGKIYPLGEFRYLPPQLFDSRQQLLTLRRGLRRRDRTVTEPLGERFPQRRQGDHPHEK